MVRHAHATLSVLMLVACSAADDLVADPTGGGDEADTTGDGEEAGSTGNDDEPVAGPDFPVRYQTRYVDIAPGFSQPVCRGTLDAIDRHVEAVASMLEIDVQTRPTFFWFNGRAEGALAESSESCDWCGAACACTTRTGEVIYSGLEILHHELVHATVTPAWRRSDVLFEEGIAHGLDGRPSVLSVLSRPSDVAGGTRHGGGHFSRWLVDRFGPANFRELFEPRLGTSSTQDEVFAAVEEIYGVPFLELEQEYFATAPTIYPAPGQCDGLEHVPSQGDLWELTATADCDAAHTFGPRDDDAAIFIAVTLDLPALSDTPLISHVTPDALGELTPCIDQPLYDVEDPRSVVGGIAVGNGLLVNSPGGRYRLSMPVPDGEEVSVRICPWNGEHPTAGEDPCVEG